MKSALEELENLRHVFREVVSQYSARLEGEITALQDTIRSQENAARIPQARLRDLRDMLTLLRNTEIKAEKGRRKDLKKIDSLIGDLTMLTENW